MLKFDFQLIEMDKIFAFVQEHMADDTARLILNREKWPEFDMDLVVNCIESRRKLKGKVRQWYDEPRLIFPYKLSAEQCSSSATGCYKADLVARIVGLDPESPLQIADLTGGLGVDSWFFSQRAGSVLYNEMQPELCKAAVHNFSVLGAGNISCTCSKAEPGSIGSILNGFTPDIIYMDPARRGEGGKKVFLIEDCAPDVLSLKDEIFGICRHILLKLSPMADISMACNRLGTTCREVHVIASGGECKELLIWMDREYDGEYTLHAVNLDSPLRELDPESPLAFIFTPSEEKSSSCTLASEGTYLFEPGKSLMKSGAFNLLSSRYGIGKLGHSTHYYLTDDIEKAASLSAYGKIFRVLSCAPLDKRSIKAAAQSCPQAEVTARNIPMDTDTLRKKLGTAPSDTYHIFALKSDISGPLLLVAERAVINT